MTSQSGLQVRGFLVMPVTDGIMAYARIYNKQKWQQSPNWQPRVSADTVQTVQKIQTPPQWLKQIQLFDHKAARQLNYIEQTVMFISDNYKRKTEFESKWSDALKENMENLSKNIQVAQQSKTLLAKSHQMKKEENRKLHTIVTGLVEEGKTAIDRAKI